MLLSCFEIYYVPSGIMSSSRSLRQLIATITTFKSIAALVMVLLFAQWLGQMHRVAHDGLQTASVESSSGTPNVFQLVAHLGDSTHSCAAFDGATLSAGICTASVAMPVIPNLHELALWIAFISRSTPFTAHFHSRAPPPV
jgi:fumarate reductase subunit D